MRTRITAISLLAGGIALAGVAATAYADTPAGKAKEHVGTPAGKGMEHTGKSIASCTVKGGKPALKIKFHGKGFTSAKPPLPPSGKTVLRTDGASPVSPPGDKTTAKAGSGDRAVKFRPAKGARCVVVPPGDAPPLAGGKPPIPAPGR
jgi:hypothetical protein